MKVVENHENGELNYFFLKSYNYALKFAHDLGSKMATKARGKQ